MNSRAARIVLVIAAFLGGLMLCLGGVMLLIGRSPFPSPVQTAAVGGPFNLTDENGKPISDTNLKGKPFLVFFGYTHCPDVCPTTLFEVSEVMRKLGPDADKTEALFVTIDPARDTPQLMKEYLSSFDPHMHGVTGDEAAIAAVAKAYRVYYRKVPSDGGDYAMDHTAIVYLMDKNGNFVAPFSLRRTPEAAAVELKRYL